CQDAAREEFADTLEEGRRRRHELVAEEVEQALPMQRPREGWILEQGFDLRGEPQPSALESVVKGLETQAIARQHEPPPRPIPDGEREHAGEVTGEVEAVFLVR